MKLLVLHHADERLFPVEEVLSTTVPVTKVWCPNDGPEVLAPLLAWCDALWVCGIENHRYIENHMPELSSTLKMLSVFDQWQAGGGSMFQLFECYDVVSFEYADYEKAWRVWMQGERGYDSSRKMLTNGQQAKYSWVKPLRIAYHRALSEVSNKAMPLIDRCLVVVDASREQEEAIASKVEVLQAEPQRMEYHLCVIGASDAIKLRTEASLTQTSVACQVFWLEEGGAFINHLFQYHYNTGVFASADCDWSIATQLFIACNRDEEPSVILHHRQSIAQWMQGATILDTVDSVSITQALIDQASWTSCELLDRYDAMQTCLEKYGFQDWATSHTELLMRIGSP